MMTRCAIAGIGALAVAALCGCRDGQPSRPPSNVRQTSARPLTFVSRPDVEPLRPVQPPSAIRPNRTRNPFVFGGDTPVHRQTGPLPPLPPPEGLPELPLPLPPQPSIRLLGIGTGRETPPVRLAVLSVSGDLVLAHVGDPIAGHYTIVKIGEDVVELQENTTGESLKIPLP
jgi:hypothetical protein